MTPEGRNVVTCCCCGGTDISGGDVLWPSLITDWRLSPMEVAYVNRQQGTHCARCRCNWRTMSLAAAIMRAQSYAGLFEKYVETPAAQKLRVLEINEAGLLTQFLRKLPGHELRSFPEFDMMQLPMGDGTYDLVVHSDTLEHVEHPVRGLAECRRVLRPGGKCVFTVPMIVDRLTARRDGLPASFHAAPEGPQHSRVFTEYGADAWRHVIEAGFTECRFVRWEYPSALAIVAVA